MPAKAHQCWPPLVNLHSNINSMRLEQKTTQTENNSPWWLTSRSWYSMGRLRCLPVTSTACSRSWRHTEHTCNTWRQYRTTIHTRGHDPDNSHMHTDHTSNLNNTQILKRPHTTHLTSPTPMWTLM